MEKLLWLVLVAAVFWLVGRKNKDAGTAKKKASIVLSALLSVVLITVSMVPAFVFADYSGRPLTGDHAVVQSEAILIDPSRTEEFESDGSCREVPVHFYFPEIADAGAAHTMPLIIFSHGAFGYYQSNVSTYMELASHGYVVISLDHPYHSFFTKDTSGKTVTVDPAFLQSAMDIGGNDYPYEVTFPVTSQWMKLRIDDMNFVIDTVKEAVAMTSQDPDSPFGEAWFYAQKEESKLRAALALIDSDQVGVMGHSLGGATAVTVGRREDISAVIDLDGTMLGEELELRDGKVIFNDALYTTPILEFQNEEHHLSGLEAEEAGAPYVNNAIMENAGNGYRTWFQGSGHMNFTDLPLFSPVLAGFLGTGSVDPEEFIDQINALVVEFFDCYLKGEGTFTVNTCY